MAIPRVRAIIREDVPGAPDWIESLLTLLNRGFTDIVGVLEHGLTATDNQLAELKTISVTMPAEFPTWHLVGATGEPPFQNGYSNFDATAFSPVSFRMWPDGMVEIRGFAKQPVASANFQAVFTLPDAYRPARHVRFGVLGSSAVGITTMNPVVLQVYASNGTVVFNEGTPHNSGTLMLDDLFFQAKAGPAAKADLFPKPFPIAVQTSGRFPIKECRAMRVVDKTDKARGVLGPVDVVWEPNGTGLTINAIWGLQPGRSYDIDLLMTAG